MASMENALREWYRLTDEDRHKFLSIVRSDPKPGFPIPNPTNPKSAEFRIRRHAIQGE